MLKFVPPAERDREKLGETFDRLTRLNRNQMQVLKIAAKAKIAARSAISQEENCSFARSTIGLRLGQGILMNALHVRTYKGMLDDFAALDYILLEEKDFEGWECGNCLEQAKELAEDIVVGSDLFDIMRDIDASSQLVAQAYNPNWDDKDVQTLLRGPIN